MQRQTANALNHWRDSEEALPVGTRTPEKPSRATHLNMGSSTAQEVFRIRTKPELYDEWQIELVDEQRAHLAARLNFYDWDCHHCRQAVLTPEISDRCPNCGWK